MYWKQGYYHNVEKYANNTARNSPVKHNETGASYVLLLNFNTNLWGMDSQS